MTPVDVWPGELQENGSTGALVKTEIFPLVKDGEMTAITVSHDNAILYSHHVIQESANRQ